MVFYRNAAAPGDDEGEEDDDEKEAMEVVVSPFRHFEREHRQSQYPSL